MRGVSRKRLVLSHNQMPTPALELCMLAHELTDCVSIVIGECELLADLISNNREAMKRLGTICQTAQRMANAISTRPCTIRL